LLASEIALDLADDIDENTSGAPFPNARKVTPANDSDILNLSVMYSRDGLRYSSAVDERIYISKNRKVSPTGHIANCIPNSPNHFQK